MTKRRANAGSDERRHGIEPAGEVHWNLTTPRSSTRTHFAREEGVLAHGGPFVVDTGQHTGRSPRTSSSSASPAPRSGSGGARSTSRSSEEHYEGLREKVVALPRRARSLRRRRLRRRRSRRTGSPCASSRRARTTRSSRRRCSSTDDRGRARRVLAARRSSSTRPASRPIPEEDGTRTGTFIALHPTAREVLIGGTFYAGEIKKSIFTCSTTACRSRA